METKQKHIYEQKTRTNPQLHTQTCTQGHAYPVYNKMKGHHNSVIFTRIVYFYWSHLLNL